MKVVIIGGGIIGLSSAYFLQESGHEVTLIDKTNMTDNCSNGNAGYVCPSHFVPLAERRRVGAEHGEPHLAGLGDFLPVARPQLRVHAAAAVVRGEDERGRAAHFWNRLRGFPKHAHPAVHVARDGEEIGRAHV